MAAARLCRLCWENVQDKKMTNLFTNKSMQRGWASRITALLDIPLSLNDHLPQHVCSRCMTRFVSLEKSSIDLAAFKRAAMSGIEHAQMSLIKATKETASQMGASPDTIREHPRSKVARRLPFQVNKSTLQQQIRNA